MQNFMYYAPTQVVFGRGAEAETGRLAAAAGAKKALVHYGGGSCVRSGLLGRVLAALDDAGVAHVELGGVKPNPRIQLAREGVAQARAEGCDFVLAVGGGSVIDSAKAIAYGMDYDGDVWDFYDRKAVPQSCRPVGCVLTIAAAGSEMSNSSVLTNEEGWLKRGCNCELCRPKFAVMNPELTYTLPPYQTASGAADILMHTMERYFTREEDTALTDGIAEALLRRVMQCAERLCAEPENYAARADIMWASSLSHNGLTGCGTVGDWACHQLEHELGGMFDCAHGAGLAAVWPAWARYVLDAKPARFAQFAVNVLGCGRAENDAATAEAGVRAMEAFYRRIGMPATLGELGLTLTEAQIDTLAEKCTFFGTRTIGQFRQLGYEDIRAIYRAAR